MLAHKTGYKRFIQIVTIVVICFTYLFTNRNIVLSEGSINVSTDSVEMYKGDERRFTIKANNAVASVEILSDNEDVARVDIDSAWIDNESLVVTIYAKGIGQCHVLINVIDGATYDEEVINTSYVINVDVVGDIGPQEVLVPFANYESGEILNGTRLVMNCETPDSIIYYSINGSPYEEFNNALLLTKNMLNDNNNIEIEMYAHKDGNYIDSAPVSYVYSIFESEAEYGDLTNEDKEIYGNPEDIPETFWIAGMKNYSYIGKAIQQENIRVYYNTKLLKPNIDYSLSYQNNINVGNKALLIVKGKGNYSGSFSDNFTISAADISDIKIDDQFLKYNGKALKISPKVVYKGKTLKNNTDYSLSVTEIKDPGKYNITVNGKGNYKGSTSFVVEVVNKKSISEVANVSIKDQSYDGNEYKPEVVFKEYTANKEKINLVEGVDYTVEYDEDCINAGSHKIVVKATDTSKYVAGQKIIKYNIKGLKLSDYNNCDLVDKEYTGNAIIQDNPRLYRKVKNGSVTNYEYLEPANNYTISYSNNIKTGTATIIFTGINGYTGTVRKSFKINKVNIVSQYCTASLDSTYEYVKGGVKPEPVVKYKGKTLVKDVDYKLTYKNNNKINDNSNSKSMSSVIITGAGNYVGKITKDFQITSKSLNKVSVLASDVSAGLFSRANVRLTDTNGNNLSGSDYYIVKCVYDENIVLTNGKQRYKGEEISLTDSIPANTVLKVYIKGKGSYTGNRTALYKTYEKKIANAKAIVNSKEYTGKEIILSKNDITLKIGNTFLNNTDYDIVSYKNNVKKGNAIVTIKGKGIYGGTKDIKFKIINKSMSTKIIFDGNGATSGSMSNQDISSSTNLKKNSFKKNNAIFVGWSTSKGGSKVFDNAALYPYDSTYAGKTITLYAVWQ